MNFNYSPPWQYRGGVWAARFELGSPVSRAGATFPRVARPPHPLINTVRKAHFITFSLTGAANHVIRIGDQWENRARSEEANFRTTMTPECQECPHLRKFPYPVQMLIVDQ